MLKWKFELWNFHCENSSSRIFDWSILLLNQSFCSINRSDEENNPGASASLNCSQLVFNCSRLILDSYSINRLKEFLIDA